MSAGGVRGVYYMRLFSRRSVASSFSCLQAMSQAALNTSDLLKRTPLVLVGLFASLSARLSTLFWLACSPVYLLGYRHCAGWFVRQSICSVIDIVLVGLFTSLSARLSTLCWLVCSPVYLLRYRHCPQHVQDS